MEDDTLIPETELGNELNTAIPNIDADIMYALSGQWKEEDKEKLRKAIADIYFPQL